MTTDGMTMYPTRQTGRGVSGRSLRLGRKGSGALPGSGLALSTLAGVVALFAFLALAGGAPGEQPVSSKEATIPFEVSGDAMPGDATGDRIEVVGNVRLTRGQFVLTADRLTYEKKSDTALAVGIVGASDGDFELTCSRLRYLAGKELAIAWGDPKVTRRSPLAEGGHEVLELRGTQVTMDLAEQRIEGLDRVVVTRWIDRRGFRTLDFRVHAEEVEIDQVGRSSLFRGDVSIESPTLGARADRAWLEEPLDRLTLLGDARAWGLGPDGQQTDRVSGNKILHFLKASRSIVFGAVEGRIRLQQGPGTVQARSGDR